MQIRNIFSSATTATQQIKTPARSAAPVTSPPTNPPTPGGISSYDFTSMTSKDLQTTINNLVKSGKLSLKDSSPLVGIAQFAHGGGLTGSADGGSNQPIDVLSALKSGIDYKQQTGQANEPNSGIQYWKNALTALQGLQGMPSAVDTYA